MHHKTPVHIILFILLLLVVCWFIYQQGKQAPQPAAVTATVTAPAIGQRTKTAGCIARGPLQDKACTPGAVFTDKNFVQICTPGYSKTVRDVHMSLKREVYAEYGIAHWEPGEYEVDHLIPLSIGGSNDIANLWPEAAEPKPGFHEKDVVENYLHREVCSGRMAIEEAQREIAGNWIEVYEKMPSR